MLVGEKDTVTAQSEKASPQKVRCVFKFVSMVEFSACVKLLLLDRIAIFVSPCNFDHQPCNSFSLILLSQFRDSKSCGHDKETG